MVPGRGTGPGRQKSPKCRAGPAGVLGRPCGTGPGYGAGSAKIADMPGWARGGAGPAPRARRGPCWSRRGCGPVQIELLPGYRAEPSNVTFSYIKPILSGTGLRWQKLKTWGGPAWVPGWTFGAACGGTGLGPPGCWAGAPGRASAGLDLGNQVWGHRVGASGVLGWVRGLGKLNFCRGTGPPFFSTI